MNFLPIGGIDGKLEESHYAVQPSNDETAIYSLVRLIASILRREGLTLSFIETFTGGMLSDLFVCEPNVSPFFLGGVVAYSPFVASKLLQIPMTYLENLPKVSKDATLLLAEMGHEALNADFTIASTGYAGPTGGTSIQPIGSFWVVIKTPTRTICQEVVLDEISRDRNFIRERSTYTILKIFSQVLFEEFKDN